MKSAAGAGADTKSKRRSSATVGAATVDPHDQVGETVEEVDSEDNENEDEIAARCVKHVKSHGLGCLHEDSTILLNHRPSSDGSSSQCSSPRITPQ